MEIVIYGARGTRTVTGTQYERYGGNTACVGVRVETRDGTAHIVLDAGTGMAAAGAALVGGDEPITVFLSHLHHDHVAGLAFYEPLFEPGRQVHVIVPAGMKEHLLAYFAPPYYPLTMEDLPATVLVTELAPNASVLCSGAGIRIAPGPGTDGFGAGAGVWAVVQSLRLPGNVHPRDGVTLYAVQAADKRVVYASDFEWFYASEEDQRILLTFAQDADLLIVDAQYSEEEYPGFAGRGHNTVRTATAFGEAASAREIILFHHDPHREDEAIDALQADARRVLGLGTAPLAAAWLEAETRFADWPKPRQPDRITAARAGMKFVL